MNNLQMHNHLQKCAIIFFASVALSVLLFASNAYAANEFEGVKLDSAESFATVIGKQENTGITTYASDQSKKVNPWKRFAGSNCFDTAALVAGAGFDIDNLAGKPLSDTVIIATWDGYWDALSAAPLASLSGAPILFTWQDGLDNSTKTVIEIVKPKKAIIVGGSAAVSSAVEDELKGYHLTVERMAGATAIETAQIIAKNVCNKSETIPDTCIIATSNGFYDALSVAPVAYKQGWPIYLTNGDLSETVKADMKSYGFKNAVIVGGEAAVPASVNKFLRNELNMPQANIQRLGGANAWKTSALIANFGLNTCGMSVAHIGIADGNGYWDALSGSVLCGKANSPLVLVPHDGKTASGDTFWYDPYCIDNVIAPNASQIEQGYIFGGPSVVPTSVRKKVTELTGHEFKGTQNLEEGAFAFFRDINATNALNILNDPYYSDYIVCGDPDDATSLFNMYESLHQIGIGNECRAVEGKNLQPLKVSIEAMATGMVNADWCNIHMDHCPNAASGEWFEGENVAWGCQYISAYFGWYTLEKYAYCKQHNLPIEPALLEQEEDILKVLKLMDENAESMVTGHYENLVSPNYVATGFGVCTRQYNMYGTDAVQDFCCAEDGETYFTVDEFGTLLDLWVSDQI